MKLVRWRRFNWDLSKLPPQKPSLPNHYSIRAVAREEERAVRDLISSTFSLDSSWSDVYMTFRDSLDQQLEGSFLREPVPALVITHGQRIIAASALNSDADAETNLVSGPCVLPEYHNRGFGTALLLGSLLQLRQSGLQKCRGICKDLVVAARFVYPKFDATSEPYEFIPLPVQQ